MPFVTPEQVRTAIDNADLAIHGAIQDGTLLQVMAALKGDIVSFILSLFSSLANYNKSGRNI
jgi:hypothetical protein